MPYATSDGVRTYYEVEGSGPPLVLYIGFLSSLEDWRREDGPYTDALRDTYQLILLDPRGQGQSDKPHDPNAYTMSVRANDVIAVLDDVGITRAHFWGYSLGGTVGQTLAVRAPNRLLSLIAGGADPFWEPTDPADHDLYRWLLLGMDGFVAAYEREHGPLPSGARERWLAEDAEALAAAWLAPERAADITDALPDIQVPTMLYVGSEDDPKPSERAARLMPDATFVELEGMNHVQVFRRSDLILPHVLAFLAKVDSTEVTD